MIREMLKIILLAKTPKQKAQKRFYSIKLKKGDIAIDCGANVGNITKHLCKAGATVYSFEPNPNAYKVLQDRFSNVENVHCIRKGVSNREGKMKLYLHQNSEIDEVYWSSGSSLLAYKGNVLSDKYVLVEIIDLCDFIESLNHQVSILKMDIEGEECRVLKKMIDTGVHNKIDYIFAETHDHKIPELKDKTDAIRELIKKRRIKNINLHWT